MIEEGVVEAVKEVVETGKEVVEVDAAVVVVDEELRKRMQRIVNMIEDAFVELGEGLYKINVSGVYVSWGYKSFDEYLRKELAYSERRGKYLIAIHKYFAEDLKDPELLNEMKSIGWTKLKETIHVCDRKNKDDIKKLAEENNAETFAKIMKSLFARRAEVKDVTTGEIDMSKEDFKKTADDAKEKAEKEGFWTFKFSDKSQKDNVTEAIEIAGKISRSEVASNNLSLICLEFISNNAEMAKKSVKEEDVLSLHLSKIEKELDIKLVAMKKDGTVIHGKELLA